MMGVCADTDAIPIFVISLKQSPERFRRLQEELARFGLQPRLVRGIDGRRKSSLLKRLWRRQFFSARHNRFLSPGEIGCFASHVRVLREIIRNQIPRAIILEDDVIFSEDFGAFYRFDLPRMLDVADIVKFEGHVYPHTSRGGLTVVRGKTCRAVVPMRPSLCSAAYAVSLRGAKSLARVAQDVDEPYDFIVHGYERHNARYCEVRPLLVKQADTVSIIGDEGRNLSPSRLRDIGIIAAARQLVYKAVWRPANATQSWFMACILPLV